MRALLLSLLALPFAVTAVRGEVPAPQRSGLHPGLQCRAAIRAAERAAGIPEQLLTSIALVESGRRGPDGSVHPWPWSINAEGTGYIFESKAQAIAGVQALQAKGVRSIDIGCMQVNLMHHPRAFATLDQAFDPVENARYAARFLVDLKGQTGAWEAATARYHSATPELGQPYQRKVMAIWPDEKKRTQVAVQDTMRANLAAAWGATQGSRSSEDGGASSNGTKSWSSLGSRQAGGGIMLSSRAASARILPMAGGGTGRRLDAYRATPIPVAARQVPRTPL